MRTRYANCGQQAEARTKSGTPAYMAPEVITHNHIGHASDVYAFGVILYELTSRQVPWAHLQPLQIMDAVRNDTDHLRLPDNADPKLAAVARDCLQRDPKACPSFSRICEELGASPPEQTIDEVLRMVKAIYQQQQDMAMMH